MVWVKYISLLRTDMDKTQIILLIANVLKGWGSWRKEAPGVDFINEMLKNLSLKEYCELNYSKHSNFKSEICMSNVCT